MGRGARDLRRRRGGPRRVRRSRAARALTTGDFDPEHRVGHLLRRAYHIAKANTGAGLRDLGITPMQAAAVMAVHRAGTLSQADLGRAIGMQPANVHGIVARLQKLGLAETTPDPADARHVLVSLAPAGRDQAAHVAALSAAAHDATLAPLDAHERDTLIALLSRIAL